MSDAIRTTRLGRDDILLTGQVALVTAGAAGIGYGVAMALAEFGADVAIADIDDEMSAATVADIEAKGRRALAIHCDVMEREQVRAAVARCIAELGKLDILVNNAGGVRRRDLADQSDRSMDRVMAFNLTGLVTATQAASAHMIERGEGGSIISVASIEGMRAAPGYAVYAACKAGTINFTRSMALELGAHGIRVNAIAPDIVITEAMMRERDGYVDSPIVRAMRRRQIPLQRAGNLDDCAGAAVFLASRMASYVTGVTISVDGGTWASSGWLRDDKDGWELFPHTPAQI